jgi:hypothetical protein
MLLGHSGCHTGTRFGTYHFNVSRGVDSIIGDRRAGALGTLIL